MEETHRNSGTFATDLVENEFNELVTGFLLKRSLKFAGFPFALSLLMKGFLQRGPPPAPLWGCPSLSGAWMLPASALQNILELPPRGAGPVGVGGCVRFLSPAESSHKGKPLGRPC